MVFTKQDPNAPAGFYPVEAAGLRWLGEATPAGGTPVAEVLEVTTSSIVLPRYPTVSPTPEAAREFGRRLALTHGAGAPHHGCAPPGVADGFIATLPLPHLTQPPPNWGDFYARCRVEPFARAAEASGGLSGSGLNLVLKLCDRLREGDPALIGPEAKPARLHGDLWSGNILWTSAGTLVIDPAAHGGHPETDLAMLALFGLPHLEIVIDGYRETAPLADGWRDRVSLHQVHPLLVHAVLFGASYGEQAARVARSYV